MKLAKAIFILFWALNSFVVNAKPKARGGWLESYGLDLETFPVWVTEKIELGLLRCPSIEAGDKSPKPSSISYLSGSRRLGIVFLSLNGESVLCQVTESD